ncbi:MAG: GlcNAc-transferase family protein [Ginsengibacter sp.]
MKHLILTRLALGTPKEDWLRHRIKLFEEFCAPSIANQTCQDFTWILAVRDNTPEWFIQRARKISPSARFIFIESKSLKIKWPDNLPRELIEPVLLTTRIDSDDAFHKDFVKEVQSAAKQQKYSCALDAPLGYSLDQNTLDCFLYKSHRNHFITLLEYGTCRTVFCTMHALMDREFPVVQFCRDKPLWTEGTNGKNISNRLRRSDDVIQWNEVRQNFLDGKVLSDRKVENIPIQNSKLQNIQKSEYFNISAMRTIFVQIASYRDCELIPTIDDMLKKAKNPERLRVGICRQYHPADKFDDMEPYKKDRRFRIIDVIYSKSKGACWARNMSQQIYMGEDYTLQIDSHMRFAKDWDETLINMILFLQSRGYPKPLLTGYMAAYDPNKPLKLKPDEPPLQMVFDCFNPEGAIVFKSETIPGWKHIKHPVAARFYSGGFCFTLGRYCKEVQHDPDFYFIGEEISITVRAYTHGYDLFHPNKNLLWHHYTRKKSVRQWDDDNNWTKRDKISVKKNRQLFGMDKDKVNFDFSKYGFGQVRTLRDYEKYAGVLFSKRAVQKHTIEGKFPPNPFSYTSDQQWLNSFFVSNRYCIQIDSKKLRELDYDFWVVAFHSEDDETIFRQDADKAEIAMITSAGDGLYEIWRELYPFKKPKYWVLWPHSKSKGWCRRLTSKM